MLGDRCKYVGIGVIEVRWIYVGIVSSEESSDRGSVFKDT